MKEEREMTEGEAELAKGLDEYFSWYDATPWYVKIRLWIKTKLGII